MYCLYFLIGDDQLYEYDDDDIDFVFIDLSFLMDSNYEFINWYLLIGLLVVLVFVGIVCFVVLCRRFVNFFLIVLLILRLLKLKF